ncbi:ankyrin repeat-containing domain protein [Chaetomium tenue]|uniref:Ankyrin repeat-containing domain protein n=1 Tax=Chaetomium tenue TaxID=1854479 RepID=A0ACB7PKU8_9PEZI|nr:ankyrin repeat-containing domain protein [Chaetomium globosum]
MPIQHQYPKGISDTGLSIVHKPEGSAPTAVVDIIIVHGLQGHPFTTWACNRPAPPRQASLPVQRGKKRDSLRAMLSVRLRKSSPNGKSPQPAELHQPREAPGPDPFIYWPRDLLPKDCPQSRVLVYGYDTKVTKYVRGATNKNSVFSHAKDLLFALSRARQLDRPLIFIAHSLGGVVVKEMLARSAMATEEGSKNIVDSTSAVVFLGTPHRGSPELAALGEWARSFISTFRMETNDAILNALNLRTTDLERAQESFSALWFKYDFRVKTFQEGLGLTGVNLSVLGNKVVPDSSSCIGDARERAETIQANHMDMCRFKGPDDPNYLKLSGEIGSIYASLVSLNEQKVHHDGHIQRQKPSLSARSMRSARSTRTRSERQLGLSATEMSSLRTLWYAGMDERWRNVEEPAAQTTLWLFEQPSYQDWFHDRNQDKHCSLLWLKGKPGAGKSTLMKAAFRRAEAQQAQYGYWTAAFFFNAKGSDLEHSPLGLFRSLLYQLLPRYPDHLRRFAQILSAKSDLNPDEPPALSESELKAFFQSMFATKMEGRTVIFVDALDECDAKTMRSQAYFWREITQSAHAAGTELSVCLSSRHFPTITVTNCPEIAVDQHNSQDIITYVDQRLGLGISEAEPERQILRDRVINKSAGVFLWVTLVVDDILLKRDEGTSLRALLGELDNIPEELETLFSSLLRSLEPESRQFTLRLFEWVVLATRPLRLYEWHHILGFIQPEPPESLAAWRTSEKYTENSDQLAKQIRTVSKGLIEIVSSLGDHQSDGSGLSSAFAGAGSMELDQGENRIVQVIHESVREYFLHGGGSSLFAETRSQSFVARGHLSIIGTCLDYINIKELDALVEARRGPKKPASRPRPGFLSVPRRAGSWASSSDSDLSSTREAPGGWGRRDSGSVKSFGSAYSHSSSYGARAGRYSHDSARAGLPGAPDYFAFGREIIPQAGQWSPKRPKPGRNVPHGESVFEQLKKASDAAWGRDYFAQRMTMYRMAPDQISVNPSLPYDTMTVQTRLLEDYPALLSYAVSEIFTHAQLADKAGADPSPVVRRFQKKGQWTRWLALAEDLSLNTGLLYFAANQELLSWARKLSTMKRLDTAHALSMTGWSTQSPSEAVNSEMSEPLPDMRLVKSAAVEAVKRRNRTALDFLLRHFGFIFFEDDDVDGHPLLHTLVAKRDLSLLQKFFSRAQEEPQTKEGILYQDGGERVPLVDRRDLLGQTALHIAVAARDAALVSELLRHHADINALDKGHRAALHIACMNSLGGGFGTGEGNSAAVAETADYDMVELLLRSGARCDVLDDDGHTALHAVCYNIPEPPLPEEGNPDPGGGVAEPSGVVRIIDLLLSYGAKVDALSNLGTTPLHMTCRAGNVWRESCPNTLAAARRLLDAGADPNASSDANERPLHVAAARAEHHIVAELIQRGAKVMARDDLGQAPLHHAAWAANDSVAAELLAHPSQTVDCTDGRGSTPLHFACQFYPTEGNDKLCARSLRLMRRLLERGAQVHLAKNWLGLSPFQLAQSRNLVKVIPLLREFGGGAPASEASEWSSVPPPLPPPRPMPVSPHPPLPPPGLIQPKLGQDWPDTEFFRRWAQILRGDTEPVVERGAASTAGTAGTRGVGSPRVPEGT